MLSPSSSVPITSFVAPFERPLKKLSPRRKLLFAAIAMFCSTVMCLCLAEIILRIAAPVPFFERPLWQPDGHITARMVPNQLISSLHGTTVRVNKHGFRGRDHEFEKPAGVLRIAVFGGSSSFCMELAEDKTWPALLEQGLTDGLGVPVEVINLGLPGYDVFNSKINYLCFGRAFHPDAIIVYHTWNDMKAFRGLEEAPYQSDDPGGKGEPLWERAGIGLSRHSQLCRRLRDAAYSTKKKWGRQVKENTYHAEGLSSQFDQPVSERAFAWEQQNFRDFIDFAQRDGVLPVLVSQATLLSEQNITAPEPPVRDALQDAPFMQGMTQAVILNTWQHVSAIIEKTAKEKDVIFVDGYRAVPHEMKYVLDHVHLAEAGAIVLADTITTCLLDDGRFLRLAARFRPRDGGDTTAHEGRLLHDKAIE
jgi:hypothetical protein